MHQRSGSSLGSQCEHTVLSARKPQVLGPGLHGLGGLAVAVILSSLLCSWSPARAHPKASRGQFSAGFHVYQISEAQPPRVAAVWYPSLAQEQPFTYPRRSNVAAQPVSRLAVDGPPARQHGPFPLIVFAHGAYGSALGSAFLCEYLARHGFVVAATDYDDAGPLDFVDQIAFTRLGPGNLMASARELATTTARLVRFMALRPQQFLGYLERRRLAPSRILIDWLLEMNERSDSLLRGLIDTHSIGMVGHSLGGLTTLGLIGAHPDPGQRDARIKAAVLLSAPVHPFQRTASNIAVPTMVMHGDHDPAATSRLAPRSLAYEKAPAPKFYVILRNATHFAFSNPPRLAVNEAWRKDECAAAICAYAEQFYRRYLAGEKDHQLEKAPPPAVVYYAVTLPGEPEHTWGTVPKQPRMTLQEALRMWLRR